MNVLAFAIVFLLCANAFIAPPNPIAVRKVQLRHPMMCSSASDTMSTPHNKTNADLEIDLYFRMEEWRSLTSTVIKKAAGEETFFEADE